MNAPNPQDPKTNPNPGETPNGITTRIWWKSAADVMTMRFEQLRDKYGEVANSLVGYFSLLGNSILLISGHGNINPVSAAAQTFQPMMHSLFTATSQALTMPSLPVVASVMLFTSAAIMAKKGKIDKWMKFAMGVEGVGIAANYVPRMMAGDWSAWVGVGLLGGYWAAGFAPGKMIAKFGKSKSAFVRNTLGDPRTLMCLSLLTSVVPPLVEAIVKRDVYFAGALTAWGIASACFAVSTSEEERNAKAATILGPLGARDPDGNRMMAAEANALRDYRKKTGMPVRSLSGLYPGLAAT